MKIHPSDLDFIRALVLRNSAIVLGESKTYLIEARLTTLARQEGYSTLQEMLQELRLRGNRDVEDKVVEAMTTNETSFFRDQSPFEALKQVVIPTLLAQKGANDPIRIWCAACSTGQEPYSLAMLLRDEFPSLAARRIEIQASDLSSEVLDRARSGRFGQFEVARGLSQSQLAKHFTRQGNDWVINESLRKMVQFTRINLIGTWPHMPKFDIVMLRNVLIYFDVATKQQILKRIRDQLNPEGYLFLGAAETTVNLTDQFIRVDFPRSGCYRQGIVSRKPLTSLTAGHTAAVRPVTR